MIRPVLGITMGPPALISRLNIDGVLVYSAPRGGPAGDAGVQGCQRSQFGDLVVGAPLEQPPLGPGSSLYLCDLSVAICSFPASWSVRPSASRTCFSALQLGTVRYKYSRFLGLFVGCEIEQCRRDCGTLGQDVRAHCKRSVFLSCSPVWQLRHADVELKIETRCVFY